MGVYRVTLVTVSEVNGKAEFVNFVSRDHDDLVSLKAAAIAGTLLGEQLHTQRIPGSVPRSFRVVSRSRCTLPVGSIRHVDDLPVLIYDERGALMNGQGTPRRSFGQPADLRVPA